MLRAALITVVILCTVGCASTQLTYNTLDIGSSFTDLYTRQVLTNLSRMMDEPHALPSQIDITAGTVQTSNSVTPSATAPLSKAITANGTGLVTASVLAGAGFTASASDSWQQNWNVLPISDANTLRNLRAIYRYAIYGGNLAEEYHIPRIAKNGKFPEDPYWLNRPQCVICINLINGRVVRVVNPYLKPRWIFSNEAGVLAPERIELDSGVVSLGHFGNHDLYMRKRDFDDGVLSDFLLFVLPNGEPTDSSKGPGTSGPRAAAPVNRPNFTPPPVGPLPAPPP